GGAAGAAGGQAQGHDGSHGNGNGTFLHKNSSPLFHTIYVCLGSGFLPRFPRAQHYCTAAQGGKSTMGRYNRGKVSVIRDPVLQNSGKVAQF
ncbi:MAG: hypothetical protein PUE19_09525, partial [bacterium]|nr:hypothetical protein [bacterium]